MLTGFSIALFVLSLTQKGYTVNRPDDTGMSGLMLLLLGWVAVLDRIPAWLANPLILAAWICNFWPRLRIVGLTASLLAMLLALSFLRQKDILIDEGGGRATITRRGAGYWLWVAGIAVQLVYGLIGLMHRR